MLWILFVVALPFLVWLWLGVTFTIIDFTCYLVGLPIEKVIVMLARVEAEQERARLIRYTKFGADVAPNLLSFLDAEKNILHIDRERAASLPNFDRERLEMTDHEFTIVTPANEGGMRFKPFGTHRSVEIA